MRVLQICSKPPVPSIDGGCKAMNNITEGLLSKNVDVKVLTISTDKHPFKKEEMSATYKKQTQIEHCYIDTRLKPLDAFVNLCKSESYNLSRFYCRKFEELIQATLVKNNFDVVILEGLFVSGYIDAIRNNSKAKLIFRAHNVEHEIWERNTKNERKKLKKIYLKKLSQQLKKEEINILNKVDAIASITQKDKKQFVDLGCKKPIEVIPFGINMSNYKMSKAVTQFSFFHIGSMDWQPNQMGIKWLVTNVWGKIHSDSNEVVLRLAGKNMPKWLLELKQNNVDVVGEVPDAAEFINSNQIMVVPLFSGSGMRVKIVEGMALGKTVIATEIALEGIDYTDKDNVLVANTESEFIKTMNWCVANVDEAKKIGEKAKELIQDKYDNDLIIKNLINIFK